MEKTPERCRSEIMSTFEILASRGYNSRMTGLEKGSTFRDGDRELKVTGTYTDGSLLVRTISEERLQAFKKAAVKANDLLGNPSRLVDRFRSSASPSPTDYFGIATTFSDPISEEFAKDGASTFSIGVTNVVVQFLAEELKSIKFSEDVFVGVLQENPDGIKYRVKCPFPKTSLRWIRTAHEAWREASGTKNNHKNSK